MHLDKRRKDILLNICPPLAKACAYVSVGNFSHIKIMLHKNDETCVLLLNLLMIIPDGLVVYCSCHKDKFL